MHISTHLDPHRLADLARDPNHCKAEAAMRVIDAKRAERATLNSAGQAINAALRPAFEANHTNAAPASVFRDDDLDDDQFTSTQPLGDASVRVVYSSDSNNSLSIDGALLGGAFVHIDNFSNHVRGQWFKAIRAEERLASASDKAAASAGWRD